MLLLHWTTFLPHPYHILQIQERGEDGVKMKQFRISKFPLRPYYVSATSLLRPYHILNTFFTFPLRPQYALTEAFFQLIAKGAPNKILSFYSSFCEIAQVQPVHQVRHGVLEGELVARVLLCSCFDFDMV